jgi:flagellar protein FlaG
MVSEVVNSTVASSKTPASVSPAEEAKSSGAIPMATAAKDSAPSVDMQKLQKDLTDSVEKINQTLRDGGRNLSFSVDPSVIGGPVVTVKNAETGEVVRQIPNEAVVRVAHNIDELKGVLYNGLT